jgi:peptide-methionine (S)-S-oxide reductase
MESMVKNWSKAFPVLLLLIAALSVGYTGRAGATASASDQKDQTAVFSGGCFWGVDAVFKHVKGVEKVTSGYAGGSGATAHYEIVSTGLTGHAESVEVVYDPSKVSYEDLLKVFFTVAHDPTELNRQGPDEGKQYRSVVFYSDAAQQQAAEAYIAKLTQSHAYSDPIVTQVVALNRFYAAEGYHQNFCALHPDNPYITMNDLPKVKQLQQKYPELYSEPAQSAKIPSP